MPNRSYKATWSKIGNSSGFRLESAFVKENPQLAGASGEVEVINSDTLLVRLKSPELEQEKEELMLSLFLDFVMENALSNSDEIESYTEEMAVEDENLIAGVVIDS
jgi:antitoxin PrlF